MENVGTVCGFRTLDVIWNVKWWEIFCVLTDGDPNEEDFRRRTVGSIDDRWRQGLLRTIRTGESTADWTLQDSSAQFVTFWLLRRWKMPCWCLISRPTDTGVSFQNLFSSSNSVDHVEPDGSSCFQVIQTLLLMFVQIWSRQWGDDSSLSDLVYYVMFLFMFGGH